MWAVMRLGVCVPLALSACGSPVAPTPRADTSTAVLVGAGDIAQCGSLGAEMTARLLDRLPGTVFTAGDNAYMSGTAAEFQQCYEPTWGRHRSRTRPTPGNHDYGTPGAAPYYAYFGAAAGPAGIGYYAYDAGPWRVVALNTEIDISSGSAQLQWLRTELTARRARCTLAILHRPRFTSGINGENLDVGALWNVLYELDVDVAISGHDHQYERFAPQDPAGRPDAARGIRQFIVGTGGATLYPLQPPRPNSEVRGSAFGVLSLTLAAGSYRWEFIPVDGANVHDSGTGICH